jgi:LysR family glycine cleavage system transcriptional activator
MPWIVMPVAPQKLIHDFQLEKPDDLSRVSILLHSSDVALWNEWSEGMSANGRSFKTIVFEAYPMVFQAAVAGLGVAMAPATLVEKELASGELVPLFDMKLQSPHQCYLVYPGDRVGRRTLHRFEEWLFSLDNQA